MKDLNGRVAVVTGSSRGLGRAIAVKLASLGAKVVVNYRSDKAAAEETLRLIQQTGGEAIVIQADVSVFDDAQRLIQGALDHFGRLDILVNNAGTTRDTLLVRMSEEEWDIVVDTNLKGVFNCCKAAQRSMLKQRYGRIVNITSIAALAGNAGQTNYSAAKAGQIGFTKALAKEVGSRNITVNAIAPGYIPTDLSATIPPDLLAKGMELMPLGRPGIPEDIANAVAFLVSDEGNYITGQVLAVDGGLAMSM
jgi:3-oxoacyl-[acyl-carrier protein] reductase